MPPPTVTCAICNATISKRQSLLVEPYGRICRNHKEVEEHQAKLAEIAAKAQDDKKMEEAMKSLQVIAIAAQMRTLAFAKGLSPEFTLFALGHRLPKEIRDKVSEELKNRGPMTTEESQSSRFMAMQLKMTGAV
jgi:predicted house-cleaning noncanonical NTP pyrophosphatase (MazG superfamily)